MAGDSNRKLPNPWACLTRRAAARDKRVLPANELVEGVGELLGHRAWHP